MSFIENHTILNFLYSVVLLLLTLVGFVHTFVFHFMYLKNQDLKTALKNARVLFKKKWLDFIIQYLLFVIKGVLALTGMLLLSYGLPILLARVLPLDVTIRRMIIVFFTLLSLILIVFFSLFAIYFMMLKLTLMFERYTGSNLSAYAATKKGHFRWIKAGTAISLVLLLIVSVFAGIYFDDIFPTSSKVGIAAHRAGGDLAHENTILGLEAAIGYNVDYAEIDVQRTSDGHYVINHDDTFERCCGDPRASYEMTLAEAKQLGVKFAADPDVPPTEVGTIEEFLDTSKDNLTLLIELKGATADEKMADEVYQMVKERDMIDQVMFIGLNYPLLDYVERTYPEIDTGYLCFFGFGDIQNMNVDYLLLESETATDANIEKIHDAGKKIGVWTVDDLPTIFLFMISNADFIITDKVAETCDARSIISLLPDELRVIELIVPR